MKIVLFNYSVDAGFSNFFHYIFKSLITNRMITDNFTLKYYTKCSKSTWGFLRRLCIFYINQIRLQVNKNFLILCVLLHPCIHKHHNPLCFPG